MKKIVKTGLTLAVSAGLMTAMTVPAYAIDITDNTQQDRGVDGLLLDNAPEYIQERLENEAINEEADIQSLMTADSGVELLVDVDVKGEVGAEILKQEREEAEKIRLAKEKAEAEAKAKAEAEAAAASKPAPAPVQKFSTVPSSDKAGSLVEAARGEIGVTQDCTDLVQNALAAIGMFDRRDRGGYDLGPMDFGRFGSVISPGDARAGDILMRGGHVAIYTGDGTNHSAVHGGWQGDQTVESPYEANPSAYIVVRI